MEVEGNTRGDINVRSSPVVTTGNIAFLQKGIVAFSGALITSAIDGKKWIALDTFDGKIVTDLFIASWVVDFTEVVPTEIYLKHTIEVWSDGSVVIDGKPYS